MRLNMDISPVISALNLIKQIIVLKHIIDYFSIVYSLFMQNISNYG